MRIIVNLGFASFLVIVSPGQLSSALGLFFKQMFNLTLVLLPIFEEKEKGKQKQK